MSLFLLQFIRVLIFITTLIPLVSSTTSFFGDVVDRTLLFWLATQLMTLCWAILCTIETLYLPRRKGLHIVLIVWMSFLGISTLLAQSSSLSFFSTFERMMGLLTYLHVFFYFLVVSSVLNRKDWQNLLLFIFTVGLISSFIGIYWRSDRNFNGRITGTLGNPSFVASYSICQIFITSIVAYGLWKSVYKKWALPVLLLASVLHLGTLILTGSRSGLVGLTGGMIVAALLISYFYKKWRVWFLALSALVLIGFVIIKIAGTGIIRIPKQLGYLNRLSEISLNTDTFLVRKNLWGIAWDAFWERPWFGWGFEGFSTAFLKYYNPALYKDGLWYDNPHNIFLEWAINGGVFGLLGFCLSFILALLILWKSKVAPLFIKSVLSGFCVSYILFNFNNFDSLSTVLMLFLFWAFVESCERLQNAPIMPVPKLSRITKLEIGLGTFCLVIFSIYFFSVKSYQVNKGIFNANEKFDLPRATSEYKKLYHKAWLGEYDVLIQAGLHRNFIPRETDVNVVQDYYWATEQMLEKELQKLPESGQLLNQLGHLNVTFRQMPKAIKYFEKFRTIAPRRQANLMDLGTVYMESGENAKACTLFEYIYNLDKTYERPLIFRAIALSKMDQFNEALETLGKITPETLGSNGELIILAFERSGRLEDFCRLYSEMSEGDRQFISQKTYWMWINAAFDSKNFVQLTTAFNCYRYSFNIPELEIMPILSRAINEGVRPVAVTGFFARNPGK